MIKVPTVLFFFNATAPTEIYTLSLHDALPTSCSRSPGSIPWWWWSTTCSSSPPSPAPSPSCTRGRCSPKARWIGSVPTTASSRSIWDADAADPGTHAVLRRQQRPARDRSRRAPGQLRRASRTQWGGQDDVAPLHHGDARDALGNGALRWQRSHEALLLRAGAPRDRLRPARARDLPSTHGRGEH